MPNEEIDIGLIRVYGKKDEDGSVNSSFVILDEKIAVIDIGPKDELWKEVVDVIKKHGRNPAKDLGYLFLTHEHPDHFGSAVELKNASSANIHVHEHGAETLRDPKLLATEHFDYSGGSSGLTRKLNSIFGKVAPVKPDTILFGDEKISLGRSTLTVIHTGSHCGGHVIYYDDYRSALFVGDEVVESPSNPCKYIIDLTGNAEKRRLILNRLLGLKIGSLIPSHVVPSFGESAKEVVNRAVDAHEIWEREVYGAVDRLGEATTEEVANAVQGSLNLDWSGELKAVATAVTTYAYLRALSARGQLHESMEEKDGRQRWAVRG